MPPLNPTTGGNKTAIHWLTMEEAYLLQQKNPKKIIVDIYAEWCGWCKRMDKTTFQEPAVIRYINDNFYAVKLDAETKRTIKLGDESFNYRSNGRGGMNGADGRGPRGVDARVREAGRDARRGPTVAANGSAAKRKTKQPISGSSLPKPHRHGCHFALLRIGCLRQRHKLGTIQENLCIEHKIKHLFLSTKIAHAN